ncbi:MAG: Na+/H+ antiporter subunit E [Gemmatimonadota bacterium]|nr:MAG: Na+/H+ antiporter subunit E [Gemmatimonadota bacterium]
MVRAFGLGVMLFGVWLLLSGHYTPLLLGFGVGSSIVVVLIAMRMDVVDHEGVPLYLGPRILAYLPWLLLEILKANIAVARIILDPALPISPIIVHFRASQETDLGRTIYANSITLTPGTITTGVDGSELEIHALTWADIDGREEDEMDHRVTRLEQGL